MSGLPSPERLVELTRISLEQSAAGAPPPVAAPIAIDEQGYAFGLCPDDPDAGCYVHAGVRIAWVPLPVQQGLLLSIWGGLAPDDGFVEEGVTAFITRNGLRRLAADLIAIADASEVA